VPLFILVSSSGLHDALDLEEALKIVDLTHSHEDQHQGLEGGPQHHPRVGVLVHRAMDLVAHLKEWIDWGLAKNGGQYI